MNVFISMSIYYSNIGHWKKPSLLTVKKLKGFLIANKSSLVTEGNLDPLWNRMIEINPR